MLGLTISISTTKPLKDNYVFDFKTIKEWLRLAPTQRLIAGCAIVIIVLFKQWKKERERNDFRANNSDKEKDRQIEARDNRIIYLDSCLAAKNKEIQLIYKEQADQYKKDKEELLKIKANSTIIKTKTDKLVDRAK